MRSAFFSVHHSPPPARLAAGLLAILLLTACAAYGATAVEHKRVLMLHSFGLDFSPHAEFSARFREQLAARSSEPVDMQDVSLLGARFDAGRQDAPFVNYLRSLFPGRPPDLVVAIGGPATQFAQRNRNRLFAEVPMILASDQRTIRAAALTANDAVVAVKNDFPAIVENILRVRPATTRLAVVLGDSPIERFWGEEMRRDLGAFADRLEIEWFNRLSFGEMKQRAAALPPRSAIVFALLEVDAAGVAHKRDSPLRELSGVANAPVFGLFDLQVGQGIVGGLLISIEKLADDAADVAVRILGGATPNTIQTPIRGPDVSVYDLRELQRWGISEQALPADSLVRFRAPGIWGQYRPQILIAGIGLLILVLLIVLLLFELARRRRLAAELEAEHALLRQIIDINPNFIFAKDRTGRFTLANAAVADAYGTTVENLVGKTDGDFNSSREEIEHFQKIDLEVLDTQQEHFIAEEHITDARGNIRWLQTVKRPILDGNGRAVQVLGASTDITRRKMAEAELQYNRAELAHATRLSTMGELAASLAHELNQPLTAILSNAQAARRFMAAEKIDLGEIREILDDVVSEGNRASGVIRSMRALVRRGDIELAPLDIVELVRDVEGLLHSDAIMRGVHLAMEIALEPPVVQGDRVQLQQVLLNLLLNAFDAMTESPPGRRVATIAVTTDGSAAVRVSVSDSGGGLAEDMLERVFMPFYTTKREGLGLGLSICRTIVEAHGGHLRAERNAGAGATFYFTLPVEPVPAAVQT